MSKTLDFKLFHVLWNPTWVSQKEWGRVSSCMSRLALSLWPQKLPYNLDSKWSSAGRRPKQKVHFNANLYILLSAQFCFTLCFIAFIILTGICYIFNFASSCFAWPLSHICIFLWTVCSTLRAVDFIQYYEQMCVIVLKQCDICGSKQERLVFYHFNLAV